MLEGQETLGQGDPVRALVVIPVGEDWGPTVAIISIALPDVFSSWWDRAGWTLCG